MSIDFLSIRIDLHKTTLLECLPGYRWHTAKIKTDVKQFTGDVNQVKLMIKLLKNVNLPIDKPLRVNQPWAKVNEIRISTASPKKNTSWSVRIFQNEKRLLSQALNSIHSQLMIHCKLRWQWKRYFRYLHLNKRFCYFASIGTAILQKYYKPKIGGNPRSLFYRTKTIV